MTRRCGWLRTEVSTDEEPDPFFVVGEEDPQEPQRGRRVQRHLTIVPEKVK